MELESLQALALEIAQERSVEVVLSRIVAGLAEQPGIALARIWLKSPGDICPQCPMRLKCPDQTECLHLMASSGNPSRPGIEDWSRLNGDFRRFPLNALKIGKIGATGEPLLPIPGLEQVSPDRFRSAAAYDFRGDRGARQRPDVTPVGDEAT